DEHAFGVAGAGAEIDHAHRLAAAMDQKTQANRVVLKEDLFNRLLLRAPSFCRHPNHPPRNELKGGTSTTTRRKLGSIREQLVDEAVFYICFDKLPRLSCVGNEGRVAVHAPPILIAAAARRLNSQPGDRGKSRAGDR